MLKSASKMKYMVRKCRIVINSEEELNGMVGRSGECLCECVPGFWIESVHCPNDGNPLFAVCLYTVEGWHRASP